MTSCKKVKGILFKLTTSFCSLHDLACLRRKFTQFNPLSPNSDENEISPYMVTARFKHSSDENKGNNH